MASIFLMLIGVAQTYFYQDKLSFNRERFSNPHAVVFEEDINSKKDKGYTVFNRSQKTKNRKKRRKKRVALRKPMQQVFYRPGYEENQDLPSSTKFIGKLLSDIDTRYPEEEVQVSLPYGLIKNGQAVIEKSSFLIGSINYRGGKRVHISFSKLIAPDGKEKSISAVALDSKDYKKGLFGEFYNLKGKKIAARIGLKMVAGMSGILVEKESISNSGTVTAKSTAKNALIRGLGDVADSESNEIGSKVESEQNYIVISSGKALIINLTKQFKDNL